MKILLQKTCNNFLFINSILVIVALFIVFSTDVLQARSLSYEERMQCKKIVERIYWEHRIWPKDNKTPKPLFENVMLEEILRSKVENDLRKSNVLYMYWQRPITGEQLQAEIERIAMQTKNPSLIKEIWNALNNNPSKIAECFARPILADRLVRSWYAFDERFHGSLKAKASAELKEYSSAEHMKYTNGIFSEIVYAKNGMQKRESAISLKSQEEIVCDEVEWNRLNELPVGKIGNLREDENQLYAEAVIEKGTDKIKTAVVVWQKVPFDQWWSQIKDIVPLSVPEISYQYKLVPVINSACANDDTWIPIIGSPERRGYHSAVWTGTEMIIWGGGVGTSSWHLFNTGGRYNPGTDTWVPISLIDAPSARRDHTAVWSGTVMIVWGGNLGQDNNTNTGAKYNPVTDSWEAILNVGAPSPRSNHSAVWTGTEMIIWGGNDSSGGRYDPVSDSWVATSTAGTPSARQGNSVVWTGTEMMVWGGFNGSTYYNNGGKYNPGLDTWTAIAIDYYTPSVRAYHAAVWTGTEMLIWGGYNGTNYFRNGSRYDPGTDVWNGITSINAPFAGAYHSAAWTGSEMIVWGGRDDSNYFSTGGKYNPATGTWTDTSMLSAPIARIYNSTIWTGTEMIIWGGFAGQYGTFYVNDGGRYDPPSNTWVAPSSNGLPEPRYYHSAVWDGTEMIIWGGRYYTNLNSGSKYDPGTDSWTPTSMENVPQARVVPSAVWTGTEMIIWGGGLNTGGRYNPMTETWLSTSTSGAPLARIFNTTVWSGEEMIVWGGYAGFYTLYNNGGKYNPTTDSWADTSLINAPTARNYHSAIWTGTEMIVWGGWGGYNTGGRYDPASDSWTDTSLINVPEARSGHSAVWTGTEMIIWGGGEGNDSFNTIEKYVPGTDSWKSTAQNSAPEPRAWQTAIWSGTEMIIWGGIWTETGGRFNPDIDYWKSTTLADAPFWKSYHTAVWTGSEMIIWGGNYRGPHNSGAIYCVQCTIQSPSNITASATGINEVTVSWSSVPGASGYNVYRMYTLCNKRVSELIASNVTATSYVDTTVEGGMFYSYNVTAFDQCESMPGNSAIVTTIGVCSFEPCFDGITAVVNNKVNPCSMEIYWNNATSSCSGYPSITYTIYRSTNPDFIPAPDNQLTTCRTGTSFTDNDVASGLTFYYIVRAEDSRSGSNGPCNGGNIDNNTEKMRNSPTGPVNTTLFSDDFESGLANWIISAGWVWNNTYAHSGLYSIFSGNLDSSECNTIETANSLILPSTELPRLHFWTRHRTETAFDFGIVQGSSDGITWDSLSLIPDYPVLSNPYFDCMDQTQIPSFSGLNESWTEYESDLSVYAGAKFNVRFNFESDPGVALGGWWIDDVNIYSASSCQNASPTCTTPPIFAGLQSAYSPASSTCQINLLWNSATSTCTSGTNVNYAIYRSTNPNFTPSPANLIASCISSINYSDTNVNFATTYFYIVRAEDSTSNGNGPCNSGNLDENLIRKNATPAGTIVTAFSDNFESGLNNWTVSGAWNWSTTQTHNGVYSTHSGNVNNQCDTLTLTNFLAPPANSNPQLFFWTYFNIENGWDGGIVEASSDGSAWNKLTLTPGYPGTTNSETSSCIGPAETCFSGNRTYWQQYRADLSSFEGGNMTIRYAFATDESVPLEGWFIDEVTIQWNYCISGSAPGAIPDNDNYSGTPLTIAKAGADLELSWSPPGGTCQTQDYGIYRGILPWMGYNYSSVVCTTGGLTNALIPADTSSYYYLVVAQNNNQEGSYGLNTDATQRPPASMPCLNQQIGTCD
ncbi:MAG: hypothetical protein A2Y62_20840 [Candidatus Fischerbacteria bacterium RBG_13_37_8]|uniref:Fibronectin type-III domain-containing protein n=1 Tax=Candidatus Fischerbacteria bacterium RBG_13_37_8 TaxID=1817863 RepID=A0A1F5VF49_9BACT|nr:MAG: hypothetical protein A2Y62_20840 [Candidatus Fischerbacteria bacterium RBG_13_37_8]